MVSQIHHFLRKFPEVEIQLEIEELMRRTKNNSFLKIEVNRHSVKGLQRTKLVKQ